MTENDSNKISIQDAIRLKHELNKSIKYGGYNAQEIQELERLNEKQRADLSNSLATIKKVWWLFPDWVMTVGFLVAIISLFYFESVSVRIFCVIAAIYCASQITYRLGVYYGFLRGFEEGHEAGVHRVLGITPEDASEINERALEMEIDDKLIEKQNERNSQPTAL